MPPHAEIDLSAVQFTDEWTATNRKVMKDVQPATIFDLGTESGSAAVWFAKEARKLGLETTIVAIDKSDQRSRQLREIMEQSENIEFLQGDLAADGISLLDSTQNTELPHPWLIVNDTHCHAKTLVDTFGTKMHDGDCVYNGHTKKNTIEQARAEELRKAAQEGFNSPKFKFSECDASPLPQSPIFQLTLIESNESEPMLSPGSEAKRDDQLMSPRSVAEHLRYTDLDMFWRAHPHYIVSPICFALLLAASWYVPAIASFYETQGMQPWGFLNALHYTAFAIILSFAFHGFMCVYKDDLEPHRDNNHKIQNAKPYQTNPAAIATRSTAILFTELVYATLPMRPVSVSWFEFTWTLVAFALFWDAWFFVWHKLAHEYASLYKFFHKTHHANKDPNCFGAYFVTYASHILLEQSVVVISVMWFVPLDVFVFTMYLGTLGTYIEHLATRWVT